MSPKPFRHRPARRASQRGAALVEMAIVAMPMLSMFFMLVQSGQAYTANLLLRNAAYTSARAAAVITNSTGTINPQPSDSEYAGKDEETQVRSAAVMALGFYAQSGAFSSTQVDIQDSSTAADPFADVCVEVTSKFRCGVPLGNTLVCGMSRRLEMKAKACHAHQGAKYKPTE